MRASVHIFISSRRQQHICPVKYIISRAPKRRECAKWSPASQFRCHWTGVTCGFSQPLCPRRGYSQYWSLSWALAFLTQLYVFRTGTEWPITHQFVIPSSPRTSPAIARAQGGDVSTPTPSQLHVTSAHAASSACSPRPIPAGPSGLLCPGTSLNRGETDAAARPPSPFPSPLSSMPLQRAAAATDAAPGG